MKLERSAQAFLNPGLWIIITFGYSFYTSGFLRIFFIAVGFFWIVFFISLLTKRYLFEVRENELIINGSFFRTQSIELAKIEKLIIKPGLFGSAKIVLKDQGTINFTDSHADYKKLKFFMEQFDITVE